MCISVNEIQMLSLMQKMKKKKKKLTQATAAKLEALGVNTAGIATEEEGQRILKKAESENQIKINNTNKEKVSLLNHLDLIAQLNKGSMNL